jgi:hypothetical protein
VHAPRTGRAWIFIADHYGKAPEDFCTDGADVTAADANLPADCGADDGG